MSAHTKTLQALIDESLSHNGGIVLGHCYLFGDELIALQELSATPLDVDEDGDDTHDWRQGMTIRGTTKDGKPWTIRMFGVECIRADDADEDSYLYLDCKGWKPEQDPRRFIAKVMRDNPIVKGKRITSVEWAHWIGGIEIASGEYTVQLDG